MPYDQHHSKHKRSQHKNRSDKYDPTELVRYLAESVVDQPDAVQVQRRGHNILIQVAAGEEGRIIGRHGRVIQAIRNIVRSVNHDRLNIDLDSSNSSNSSHDSSSGSSRQS